jgi:hypothetical protein
MKLGLKNKTQQKTRKAENEEPEESKLPSEEIIDIPDTIDDEIPAFDKIDSSIPEVQETESAAIIDSEKQPLPENTALSNKQKIAAIKRSIQNKQYNLDREQTKVKDWRVQGADRIDKATKLYEKRKAELEDALKKTEERFNKSIGKTQKMWLDYSDNYEKTKIKKIEDDIILLQTELSKNCKIILFHGKKNLRLHIHRI